MRSLFLALACFVSSAAGADIAVPPASGWVGSCKARLVKARAEMAHGYAPFSAAEVNVPKPPALGAYVYLQLQSGAWFDAGFQMPWDDPRPDEGWREFPGNDDRFFRARLYAVGHGSLTVMGPVHKKVVAQFETIFERAIDDCHAMVKP